jgi:endonuclease YncB( thermonuclease family)
MTIRRKVERVIDGDTFKVARSIKGSRFVRIAGKHCKTLKEIADNLIEDMHS